MCDTSTFQGVTNSRHIPGREGVYLIHSEEPIGSEKHSAQHYLGWSWNMSKRFVRHKQGDGSKLTQAMREQGVVLRMARIWPGSTRALEQRFKRRNGHIKHLCPICNPDSWWKYGAVARGGELTDALPFGVDYRQQWPTSLTLELKFRHRFPEVPQPLRLSPQELAAARRLLR